MKARIRSLGENASAPAIRAFESQDCIFDVIKISIGNKGFKMKSPPNSIISEWYCLKTDCCHLDGGDWHLMSDEEALDYI